jgi:hypothetical protein
VVVKQAAQFLAIESVSVSSVDAAINDSAARTTQGGSEFSAVGFNSPLDLPAATISVLFRPFLFEASSLQMLIAAVEGTILLGLLVLSWRGLREIPRRLRTEPYLALCLAYTFMFIYAFSSFSNFGILTRQRVTVLPFALVFLALSGREMRLTTRTPIRQHREEIHP